VKRIWVIEDKSGKLLWFTVAATKNRAWAKFISKVLWYPFDYAHPEDIRVARDSWGCRRAVSFQVGGAP